MTASGGRWLIRRGPGRRSLRLRTKLILAYLVPVLALFGVAGVLAYRAAHRALEDELGRRLADVARTVAGHWTTTREGGRIARLDADPESAVRRRLTEWLVAVRDHTEARRIFVFRRDESGGLESVLDTDDAVAPGSPLFDLEQDRSEIDRLFSGESPWAHSILFTAADGARYLHGYAALEVDGAVVAGVGVAGSAAYFDVLDGYRTALLVAGVLVVALVVLVSLVVSLRLTNPIGRLVEAIRRLGRGELKEPVAVGSRDEIGFMAEAFNDMRARLDRRDEQMQLMLSGIAHEVRNPLAGMELFCNLLYDELPAGAPAREYVEKITRELDYLARVVREFLSYARRRPLSPERFEAAALVDEVLEGVSGLALERDVTVSKEVEEGVDLTGERETLRGVLANLLQNAVQACSAKGRVRIEVRADGDKRRIVVADTGRGIAQVELSRIFEPFFTTKEQGTGLGLALVDKTVRDHGGRIDVRSTLGRGSEFTVELPFDTSLLPRVHVPDYERPESDVEMIG